MVKILIDEKMVQKDDKGILSLTQKGSECAKEIYEKHCFSYELLFQPELMINWRKRRFVRWNMIYLKRAFKKLKELFKNMNAPRNR